MGQCVSPEPVLKEMRQCSPVATRQSKGVNVKVEETGKGKG